jgi:soluble lytic murein transglycosylase-like protein
VSRGKPISVATARHLVAVWRQTFQLVPASVCMTLMEVESSFIPDAHAQPTPEQIARGAPPAGAWGLLQVLPTTAADMVRDLRALGTLPREVVDTLALWEPTRPECLATATLGSLVGVAYLNHLAKLYGPELDKLAAAYHNGPGFLRDFLAGGGRIPDDLPPKGRAYVLRARLLWPKYSADDNPPPAAPAVA